MTFKDLKDLEMTETNLLWDFSCQTLYLDLVGPTFRLALKDWRLVINKLGQTCSVLDVDFLSVSCCCTPAFAPESKPWTADLFSGAWDSDMVAFDFAWNFLLQLEMAWYWLNLKLQTCPPKLENIHWCHCTWPQYLVGWDYIWTLLELPWFGKT